MSQQPLELILARQFADSQNVPAFIVDPEGNLIFYNEGAEELLGIRYSETGTMEVNEWATIFTPTDEDGNPIPPEGLPLVKTLATQKPAHGSFYLINNHGHKLYIYVSSFPIEGKPDRYVGGMAFFWKTEIT